MNRLKLLLSVAFLSVGSLLFSQTINDAGAAFNNGGAFFNAKNYPSAIDEFKKCIKICNGLGSEAAELLSKAQSSLFLAYINHGKAQYKSKKFDNAISTFQAALKGATSDKEKRAASQYVSRAYNSKGTALYSNDKFTEAITAFDKSLEFDPKYENAVFGKALVYKKQNDVNSFKAAVDQVIAMAPATDKTVLKAKSTAAGFFTAEGGKAIQAKRFQKAIDMINMGISYKNNDAQAYYFTALAYNGLSQWNKAIEAGNKAVSLEKGKKSNIYFELAKAYEGAGNKSQACIFYKKVVEGPNVEAAKYKITQELKCD